MAINRTVYHVVPNARQENCVLCLENNHSVRDGYGTKGRGVHAAKEHVRSPGR